MDVSGSQCPESSNSTDCLLRAVLQLLRENREADDAGIDWDPINFTFTLLIGCVAIFFALATIIQAMFAAGKGRRRSNYLAIGKWSNERKITWDWSEMNFQFMAYTPLLREESLPDIILRSMVLNSKEPLSNIHADDGVADRKYVQKIPDSAGLTRTATSRGLRGLWAVGRKLASYCNPSQSQHPYAAWHELFEEFGFNQLEIRAWDSSIRRVYAGYLPDDLIACPAYAQVGLIVAAAAMTGIRKLDINQQRYPVVIGRRFQIDFLQHPTLGVIGAYSRYDNADKSLASRTLDLEGIQSAMRHGRGIIEAENTMDLSTEFNRKRAIRRWNMTQKRILFDTDPRVGTFALKVSAVSEVYLPLIVGLFAQVPKRVPILFPAPVMRTSFSITAISLNGKYWAEAPLTGFRRSHDLYQPQGYESPYWDSFTWYDREDVCMGLETRKCYHTIFRDQILARAESEFEQLLDAGLQDTEVWAIRNQIEQEMQEEWENTKERGDAVELGEGGEAGEAGKIPTEAKSTRVGAPYLAKGETTGSKSRVGQAKDSGKTLKPAIGHRVALHLCLKLLQGPEELEEFFFDKSSDAQLSLRYIVNEQMKGVDEWLRGRDVDINGRSILLCNTTIAFLKAEQMIKDRASAASGSETNIVQHSSKSVERNPWQNTNSKVSNRDTASGIHFTTVRALRDLVDNFDETNPEVQNLTDLVEFNDVIPPSRLWDRLRALVVYHSEEDSEWPLWKQFHEERNNKPARDIDDIIIYRCLLMILLLRTATDSTSILESGLWDKVVPII